MSEPIIHEDGWSTHNIWEHSATVRDLYRRRARDEVEEMTCAAQAAEILSNYAEPGQSLLDAGCGSGYLFHSVRKRALGLEYFGIDATSAFIDIGRRELSAFGLPKHHLSTLRIEDFRGSADHVLCLNVLSNIDNYHRPLERLLKAARKTLILRESIKDGANYRYVRDNYLNPGISLKVHVNAYDRTELMDFIANYGFAAQEIEDRRTGGSPEDVIGYPHWWTFIVAIRDSSPQ